MKHTHFSPTLHIVVDGQWGGWTAWTTCSKTCGGGEKTHERECNDPEPDHGGADCSGNGQETDPCNQEQCPGNKTSPIYFMPTYYAGHMSMNLS